MTLKLFNTLTRKKEEFKPIKPGHVGFYSCGPTVYNFAHIGNLRAYLFNDTLKRILLFNGLKVKHVMNYTDVGHMTSDEDEGDDKMEKGARREGKTVWEVAQFYIDAFNHDVELLNIIPANIRCRATEHIKDQIDLITKLERNGLTYKTSTGVYFDTSKFEDYGKMARLSLDDLKAGARIDVDEEKKHPRDFLLWAFTVGKNKNHIMHWDSPWGDGFPGWHIECSAMSSHYLGEHIDIHTGGIDHIPVHHTNETAQSEGAFQHQWVNYWLHSEFLILDKDKMAKSGENFITLKTLTDKGYDPLAYRYFCLNTHYRMKLSFSFENLDGAVNGYNNLIQKVRELKSQSQGEQIQINAPYHQQFLDAVNDDLNTPKALAVLWTVLKGEKLSAGEKLALANKFDEVLGLRLADIKQEEQGELDAESQALFNQRVLARKNKDFKESDRLRDLLKEKGILVEDTKDGQKWKKLS